MLDGFQGVLQSDGYEGCARYAEQNSGVIRLTCFAHGRGKFNDALEPAPIQAGFMLRLIGHLFRIEQDWDERNLHGAERARRRTKDFVLTLRLLKKAALLLMRRVLPQSSLGKACRFCWASGRPWSRTAIMAKPGSTPTSSKRRSAPRPSERRTSCSSAISTPATVPRSFTRLLSPASAAASIPSTTSALSSRDCRR